MGLFAGGGAPSSSSSLAAAMMPSSSSGGAGAGASAGGGVWKSRIHRFGPLGIEVEKQGFRTAWLQVKSFREKSQIGLVVVNFSRSISPYM
jgi:hypothetical protein